MSLPEGLAKRRLAAQQHSHLKGKGGREEGIAPNCGVGCRGAFSAAGGTAGHRWRRGEKGKRSSP